ncbi:cell division control protein 2 homolog [Cornus florida]|uniref:cell division control protein 2 homolog n=1 Tax=Cornus florida TaxID=4283 RepID=UPI0028995833|nr:cell division control protein 2 homolog [Cornus florida]
MDKKYELIEKIGEGSFHVVYKCRDRVTKKTFSLKRISFRGEEEGVPSSVIKQISLLKGLDHVSIIRVLDVITLGTHADLISKFQDLDLSKFIASYSEIAKDQQIIKRFLYQILCGVAYCHSHKVIHRDLKPKNLLIDIDKMVIQIDDFGFARAFGVPLTNYIGKDATLGYKAPELLLSSNYSTPVDVWAVGCIFAEMVTHRPLFCAESEINVLMDIFSLLGVPTEATWPGVTSLCRHIANVPPFLPQYTRNLRDEVAGLEPAGLDLLSKMLCLDPSRRITAADACQHSYFGKGSAGT